MLQTLDAPFSQNRPATSDSTRPKRLIKARIAANEVRMLSARSARLASCWARRNFASAKGGRVRTEKRSSAVPTVVDSG